MQKALILEQYPPRNLATERKSSFSLTMGLWERELKDDLARYGPENFVFEVLDKLKPVEEPDYDYREDLKALEELWLEKLEPYGERGYNKIR